MTIIQGFSTCGGCPSLTACTNAVACLEGLKRGKRKVNKSPEWRMHPTPTFHWGSMPVDFHGSSLTDFVRVVDHLRQRWYKSKRKAVEYARANYTSYIISDYQER